MPVYDYTCQNCHNRVGIRQTYAEYGVKKVTCPLCGSANLQRLINKVRIAKSEDRRMDDMDESSLMSDVDENDPRSMARAMRKMGAEMGGDLPPEFNEITNRLEAGEDPESIEQSMPELGDAAGGASAMGGADDY